MQPTEADTIKEILKTAETASIQDLYRQGYYDDLVDTCVEGKIASPLLYIVLLEFGHDLLKREMDETMFLASTKWLGLESSTKELGKTVEVWDIGISEIEDYIRQCETNPDIETSSLRNYWSVFAYVRYYLYQELPIPKNRQLEILPFIDDQSILGLLLASPSNGSELERNLLERLQSIKEPIQNYFLQLGVLSNPRAREFRSKLALPKKIRSPILYAMIYGTPGPRLSATLPKWRQILRYSQAFFAALPAINLASDYLRSQSKGHQD